MRGLLRALTVRGRSFVASRRGGSNRLRGAYPRARPGPHRSAACRAAAAFRVRRRTGQVPAVLRADRILAAQAAAASGETASLTIKLTNVSRLRTGLLLAEDTVPYALGSRPRFIFEGISAGGSRAYTYQLGSDTRGRYTIGPLRVRVADSFGLVSITRAFTSTSVLTITPRIIPLARPPLGGYWLGDSEHGRRSIAASGEDDVAPRAYRTGDSLQRVHWRSTARYGELMVRREEQYWRNTASLFLDTRRSSYSSSLFELAVTAAASIGVHLAGEGFEARFVTSEGEVPRQGSFRDALLDTLAVLRPSRTASLEVGIQALGAQGGLEAAHPRCSGIFPRRRRGNSRRGAARGSVAGISGGAVPRGERCRQRDLERAGPGGRRVASRGRAGCRPAGGGGEQELYRGGLGLRRYRDFCRRSNWGFDRGGFAWLATGGRRPRRSR